MVIKIFSDIKFLPKNFQCHLLLPFWPHQKDLTDPDANRFEHYIAHANNFFSLSSFEDCDIAIYPTSPTIDPKEFERFQLLTGLKKLIVFFNDDSDINLNYRNNIIIFRTSFYKSTQRMTEFALPAWSMDYGCFAPKQWNNIPTIGFCGQVYPLEIRKMALDILEQSKNINCNFIRRNNFWGGWIHKGREKTTGQQVRQEFLNNIQNSDYILCARGGGNFSYRLYETMMCGRIPVLINTDCVLPFDFLLEWKKLFIIVDQNEIGDIANIIIDYHKKMTNTDFIKKQKEMREVWESWLSPTGFFGKIHLHWSEK
jgi:hypothetical protein